MNLRIGLLKEEPAWLALLSQIGVPFYHLKDAGLLKSDPPVVLIVNHADPALAGPVKRYLQAGGSVLTEADTARRLLGADTTARHIRYLTNGPGGIFHNFSICDLPGRREIVRGAQHLPDQTGNGTTAVQEFGPGCAIIFPAGLAAAKFDYRACRRCFPGEEGGRNPSERVSRGDKGTLRRLMLQAMQYLFFRRSLPLVRLWPFPAGAPTVFAFRIDTDFATPPAVRALYECCRRHAIPATWFVETKSAAGMMEVYAGMQDQEIGYHCYRHRLFSGRGKLADDFRRGLAILKTAAPHPRGYAAPFGEWTPELGQMLAALGFQYSSEFVQGYDDMPFHPGLSGRLSPVWQVPVHPVSVGRLRWARHDEAQMRNYYCRVVREKMAIFEPVILYHHPGQAHLGIFEQIFQQVRRENLPVFSLGNFVDWWQHRASCRWTARLIAGGLQIEVQRDAADTWLAVDLAPGKSRCFPLRNQVIADYSGGKMMAEEPLPPRNAAALRKITAQMLAHDVTWHYSKFKQ